MDFTFSDEQQAVGELATQIFTGQVTIDRVKEIERTDDRFDRELWVELAKANLLGVFLPVEHGGSGLGMTELCLILEQQGRRLAAVPLVWGATAAMTITRYAPARPEPAAFAAGEQILTAALSQPGAADVLDPSIIANADGTISGVAVSVPFATVASAVLVPARTADGVALFLAPIDGVAGETVEATNHELLTHLSFEQSPAFLIATGAEAVQFAAERALVGLAALQLGVAEEALTQAAAYTSTRVQFGKPLSSFQSTSARAADSYIDTEAMRATMWQAAWCIDVGRPASLAVEVAKWWASEAGQRVVHATQHMHGGIGADVEYPIHRYFLWGKQIEDTLGGGSAHLARIGQALASA
jgi:alkylation response protein AidB-like acyl-CoA dehydrogenase